MGHMNSKKTEDRLCVTAAASDIQGVAKFICSEEVKEERAKIRSKKQLSTVTRDLENTRECPYFKESSLQIL